MTARWQRVIRGLLAAGVSVFVAEFAHIAGGGRAPAPVGVALAFAFATLACIALAGRRLALVRITASVILSQGAFHLLFDLFGTGHSATVDSSGMDMGAPHLLAVGATTTASAPGDAMWLAHAAAAAITIAALMWGERAGRSLASSALVALTRALRLVGARVVVAPPTRGGVEPISRSWASAFLALGLRHRGPPRQSASA